MSKFNDGDNTDLSNDGNGLTNNNDNRTNSNVNNNNARNNDDYGNYKQTKTNTNNNDDKHDHFERQKKQRLEIEQREKKLVEKAKTEALNEFFNELNDFGISSKDDLFNIFSEYKTLKESKMSDSEKKQAEEQRRRIELDKITKERDKQVTESKSKYESTAQENYNLKVESQLINRLLKAGALPPANDEGIIPIEAVVKTQGLVKLDENGKIYVEGYEKIDEYVEALKKSYPFMFKDYIPQGSGQYPKGGTGNPNFNTLSPSEKLKAVI